jgi:hypothetical protein
LEREMNLSRLRKFALALPEVTEEPHHHYASWRVRGKIFVTIPPGEQYLHAFVSEAERERLLELHPEGIEKLMWGSKVAGVRVSIARNGESLLKSIIENAWSNKSPGKKPS